MHSILDRYVRKIILLNIFIIFLILVSLSSILRLIEGLRSFGKHSVSIFWIFFSTFLNLSKDFELFLIISTLLGGLLGLGILETRNELMIMKIFGLSNLQISFSIVKVSVFVLFFNLIFNQWLLPFSQKLIYLYHSKYCNSYFFSEKNKNLWLIDGNNSFVFIESMLKYDDLLGVNVYFFTEDKRIEKIVSIERAIYFNKNWSLLNTTELNFSNKNHVISKKRLSYKWDTILNPSILSIITTSPRVLSISKLIFCIEYFTRIGQNSKYYQLILYNKILSPFVGVIMLLIAVLYSFGPLHNKKISVRLFFGSMIGFLFYILYQVFGSFSIIYNISPVIGSIIPIVLFLVINLVILLRSF